MKLYLKISSLVLITALAGCQSMPWQKTAAAKAPAAKPAVTKPTAPKSIGSIDHITFTLPPELPWQQVSEQNTPEGGIYAKWLLQDMDDNHSPVRVIYQRITPRQDPQALARQLISPFAQNCSDLKQTPLKLASQYPQQLALEHICARYAQNNFGSLMQTVIMSDANANHVLFTEAKTPPAAKAGVLTFRNEAEKQQVAVSQALIGLLQKLLGSLRVCNTENHCQ